MSVCGLARGLILAAALGASALGASPALTLAPVFTDNMVLQRGQVVPVWGTADAGLEIAVGFAGQRKTTKADASGKWSVNLDPLSASAEPRALSISSIQPSALPTLRLTNILVGEVWLAAGQSNMEWPLVKEAHAAQELPAATNSLLRLLNLPFAGQYFFAQPFGSNEVARLNRDDFFRGSWQTCSPQSAKDFSAVAYYFGLKLQHELNVPVGVINLAVGGSPTEAWIAVAELRAHPQLRLLCGTHWLANTNLDAWCQQRGHENLDTPLAGRLPVPADSLGPNHPLKPGFLYDSGIARLKPFAIRGVLWYQGESNSLEPWRVQQHAELFPLLVASWRQAWRQDLDHAPVTEFPFLYCQLSSISTNAGYKAACWPEFREQQRRFLETIPDVGMAVTSDLGHPTDVHPRNKLAVGHRLALWALAKTYGKAIPFSGPLPAAASRNGERLAVRFNHADGGLRSSDGKSIRGFEISGADGMFHPATAEPVGDQLALRSGEVSNPVAVRYAWKPFTDANLVNGAGLPASTFRMEVKAP